MGKKLHAHNTSLQNSEAIHETLAEEGGGEIEENRRNEKKRNYKNREGMEPESMR